MNVLNCHIDDHFAAYHGDNVEVIDGLPENSIDLTVTSPPFPSMYVYNNTPRDIGNTTGIGEMVEHFRFLVRGLLRATKPGRSCCLHMTQIPAFKHADGYVGRFDFRGDLIRLFQAEDWIWAGEVTIDKCPQLRRARTNDQGLVFKNLVNDSAVMTPVMADYLLIFRKKGKNPQPIQAGRAKRYPDSKGWVTDDEWIDWAQAIWGFSDFDYEDREIAFDAVMRNAWYRHHKDEHPNGIRETDVLNGHKGAKAAKDSEDERHLCPLQLGFIERCVKLWSAPGEVVYDPFGGIFSTGFVAIKHKRKFVGMELKESYYKQGVRNCQEAVKSLFVQRSLLDNLEPLPAYEEVLS